MIVGEPRAFCLSAPKIRYLVGYFSSPNDSAQRYLDVSGAVLSEAREML
jgi:hypothetical protein